LPVEIKNRQKRITLSLSNGFPDPDRQNKPYLREKEVIKTLKKRAIKQVGQSSIVISEPWKMPFHHAQGERLGSYCSKG
jgi:hypothetical protein